MTFGPSPALMRPPIRMQPPPQPPIHRFSVSSLGLALSTLLPFCSSRRESRLFALKHKLSRSERTSAAEQHAGAESSACCSAFGSFSPSWSLEIFSSSDLEANEHVQYFQLQLNSLNSAICWRETLTLLSSTRVCFMGSHLHVESWAVVLGAKQKRIQVSSLVFWL